MTWCSASRLSHSRVYRTRTATHTSSECRSPLTCRPQPSRHRRAELRETCVIYGFAQGKAAAPWHSLTNKASGPQRTPLSGARERACGGRRRASRGAEDLLDGRAPLGRVGEGVGQHLGRGHRHAAVEARVQLLPLAPVDVEERLRRHRAVEVEGAVAHLIGDRLAERRVVADERVGDGDVLHPLALLDWARRHRAIPQHVAEHVGAQEALGVDLGVELGVLEHARAEEGVERTLVDLGVGEVHHVLVEVVGMLDDQAARQLLAEGGVALEANAADGDVDRKEGAIGQDAACAARGRRHPQE
eukprot:6765753-Prymnesium_polylepis.1